MADHLRGHPFCSSVAPPAFWIPVPRFREELGVLAVADSVPTGRLNFFDELRGHDFVGNASAKSMNVCTQ
jgi:hypothetical protein